MGGRLLLVLLFVSILHLDMTLFNIVKNVVGLSFIVLVAIGACYQALLVGECYQVVIVGECDQATVVGDCYQVVAIDSLFEVDVLMM